MFVHQNDNLINILTVLCLFSDRIHRGTAGEERRLPHVLRSQPQRLTATGRPRPPAEVTVGGVTQ